MPARLFLRPFYILSDGRYNSDKEEIVIPAFYALICFFLGFFYLTENLKEKKGRSRFELGGKEASSQLRVVWRAVKKTALAAAGVLILCWLWPHLPLGSGLATFLWLAALPLALFLVFLLVAGEKGRGL